MREQKENNKRIAKNTIMLYIRMLFLMGVSLYTSRIILNVLGVEDFGIYNVVAGFVTMLSFLNNALATATQRFFSFEIGKKDILALKNVFSMSLNIHFIISLLIVVLAETIGLWFFNTRLNIPEGRIETAFWVYQFSVLTMVVNMTSVPYNALIIAHERMNVFAWVGIAEALLKLLVVYFLIWFGFDKLRLYAVLMFGVAVLIRFVYTIYCKSNFSESKFRFYWNKELYGILISYAGWNLWGNMASVIKGQGVNVLLNVFFGPLVNAARGIAYQVQAAVNSFVANFQMALNPQIIKSYASNNLTYMHQLIFQGAKFSFFLLYAISLPILLETETTLKLWLKIVPQYSVVFTQLVIINVLVDCISGPLMTAAQASGKIRLYQAVVGGLLILNLPVSYIFLKLGFEPQSTIYVSIAISVIALIARLLIVSPLVQMSIKNYIKNVILRIIPIVLISFWIPLCLKFFFMTDIIRLIWTVILALITVFVTVYLFGINQLEREYIRNSVAKFLIKKT